MDWASLTDEQLAADADRGLSGQGSVVEAMRRLRESTAKQQSAMKTLTKWVTWLTFVLVVFSAIQVALIITEWAS